MSTEPITGLTYQDAGSLQTDALQNAELNYYGAWLNCVVKSVGDTAPPGSPADGDRYIVGASATGAWATHDDTLAAYRDGWQFYSPIEGVTVRNLDDASDWIFEGSGGWAVKAGGGGGGSRNTVSVLATSGSVAVDYALGDYFTLALAGNVSGLTFSNLPGSGKGSTLAVRITQDSTPRTVTWPASFKWVGAAPSVSTGSGVVDLLVITTHDNGSTWLADLAKAYA